MTDFFSPAVDTCQPQVNEARLQMIGNWIIAGRHMPTWSRADVEEAVRRGYVDRVTAARYARKYLSWVDAWEICYAKRYRMPPQDFVRPEWRTIGSPWLTEAERALSEQLKRKLPIADLQRIEL